MSTRRRPTRSTASGRARRSRSTTCRCAGELPDWLTGSLIRNGPGTFQVGDRQRYRHWFDGLAMLHRFTINEGRVSYANRFLETESYRIARDEGRIAYPEFATDPCRSMFARAMAVFDPQATDSAKVNIARVADHYLALAETPIQVEFDPETLRTVGVTGWDTSNFGRMTTVHPHLDEDRHEAINLVTRYGAVSTYVFRRVDTTDPGLLQGDTFASRAVREPSYIHSFGMSERYLVLVEFPLVVNPISLLLWLRPYIENFRWKPGRGTRIHVFDRATGTHVRSVTADPFFAFHHVNAYDDDDGSVVVDLVAYDDASVIESFYLHRLSEPDVQIPPGTLRRLRVPLTGPDETAARRGALADRHRAAEHRLRAPQHQSAAALRLRRQRARRSRVLRPAGQDRRGHAHHRHLARARTATRVRASSSVGPAARPKTTASCCRSCSTPRTRDVIPAGAGCRILHRDRTRRASASGAARLSRPVLRRPARSGDPSGQVLPAQGS